MDEKERKVNELLERLNELAKRQEVFEAEIRELKAELFNLLHAAPVHKSEEQKEIERAINDIKVEEHPQVITPTVEVKAPQPVYKTPIRVVPPSKPLIDRENLEKFIGENLINKIGILILILGVGVGSKYAIEHDLVSPLTRIILGYLIGVGLLGFAIKLKEKYENFSAVLLSGAIATLYLITFAAYSFYSLFPQAVAFGLMVLFTIFAVIAAINYARQVIAHIGLVGAYAVPFLLSDGSGKVVILFTYMAIINTGILVIAIKKYWKPLYYSAFALTWIIYAAWYFEKYQPATEVKLALIFAAVFFVIFYSTFLIYKLLKEEKFVVEDIAIILFNSFIFYGIGYLTLDDGNTGQYLGLFTLANAIVHFAVSVVIYKKELADKNLFYLISGLVLTFITIAIPVQLDGNWVTLLWSCEAALLFWIGRTRNVVFYEQLSCILMLLAFFSILQDWSTDYRVYDARMYNPTAVVNKITPLFNIHFLTSLIFIASFSFITYIQAKNPFKEGENRHASLFEITGLMVPALLLIVLYGAFAMEIISYWHQLYIDSAIRQYNIVHKNEDLNLFQALSLVNYSLVFVSVLSWVNIKIIKSDKLALANVVLNVLAMLAFLTVGLDTLNGLTVSYVSQEMAQYYDRGIGHVLVRYVSLLFAGGLLFTCYGYSKQQFFKMDLKVGFDALLHISLLTIASTELINWMHIFKVSQYNLAMSILWGIYSLILIVLGIWKRAKHLRFGAIGLFAITLVKLFFYDIEGLDTIAKTIVFVSLGVLLLIISFLYNKYKGIINNEVES